MATQPTEILSVDEAKAQLRIDDDDTDMLLNAAIAAAVADAARRIGRPLIDRELVLQAKRPEKRLPLAVPTPYMRAMPLPVIRYWEPEQELRENPTGEVDAATLGRTDPVADLPNTLIYPPAAGWPDSLRESTYQVTVTVGWDVPEADGDSLVQAIALLTRHYYEAPDMMEAEFAVNSLLARWIAWPGLE